MAIIFTLLVGIFGGLYSSDLQAADLITSRAMITDVAGKLSIDEVTKADFSPSGAILTKGYTDSVHWLRITVQPQEPLGPVALRIRPTFLDDVRLYEPDEKNIGGWITRITGDQQSYNARDSVGVSLGFVVNPREITTYYLRLKTTSTSMMSVEALSIPEAQYKDLQLDIFAVLYLAFMSAMLFWAVSDFATHRQTTTLLFIAQQVVYEIYTFALLGYLAPVMPNATPFLVDKITSLVSVAIVGMAILFHRQVLTLYSPPRILLLILDGLVFVTLINLFVVEFGAARLPLAINAMIALLLAPLFVMTSLLAKKQGEPNLKTVRIIYGVFMVSLGLTVLPLLGIVQATEWSMYLILIHGLIGATLMFAILFLRSRQLQKVGQEAKVDLQLAQQQLRLEREQKNEQSRFMLMLTHELKTPMAVVRMALDALRVQGPIKNRADQALLDMNQIVERCQQVEQLEQERLELKVQACDLNELLHELQAKYQAPEKIELQIEDLPLVQTDVLLLRIILDNLLGNAVKYAAPNTPITVRALTKKNMSKSVVCVSVQNQPGAAGVPDARRVFEKYYRSAGAIQQTGSGLGLYLVHNIASLLGGEVVMEIVRLNRTDTSDGATNAVRFTLAIPC
jgi:two-component system, sensor histidine kinase LadS